MHSNPILGTILHAVGGASAAACYTPFQGVKRWSWETFWLVQAFFAWLIVPLIIGCVTVPDFFRILADAPSGPFWGAFILGAVYGFGGLSFGYAIQNIGYSLTYTISIGISAILGMIAPAMLQGKLMEYFSQAGAPVVIAGMALSIIGVACCGWAGFRKERDLRALKDAPGATGPAVKFNMMRGLLLAAFAGVFSAIFNISLETGQPIADMAAAAGAGHFQGNAKQIVSTSGCLVVNFVWFVIAGVRHKTIKELVPAGGVPAAVRARNFIFAGLAGSLWAFQFLFYSIAHVYMGAYQFVSWALHMTMLIFFSYFVGIIMKEWKQVSKMTFNLILAALVILLVSFITIGCGTNMGN